MPNGVRLNNDFRLSFLSKSPASLKYCTSGETTFSDTPSFLLSSPTVIPEFDAERIVARVLVRLRDVDSVLLSVNTEIISLLISN